MGGDQDEDKAGKGLIRPEKEKRKKEWGCGRKSGIWKKIPRA
jgi:hypothetical protein